MRCFLNFSFLSSVFRNTIGSCTWILCPITLQTSFILMWVGQKVHLSFSIDLSEKPEWTSLNSLFVESLGFSFAIVTVTSSWFGCLCFYFPNCYGQDFQARWIKMVSGHTCLVSDLQGNALGFSPLIIRQLWFCHMGYVILTHIASVSSLLRLFFF